MNLVAQLVDLFLHLDRHLGGLINTYSSWIYGLLLVVIFCETGLVVTPFLPGDSLLFAAGAFAAKGSLSLSLLFVVLAIAAVAGDTANYWIGRKIGPKVFSRDDVRFLNKKHLDRTHAFYEKHGGKTIIIARFIPIIRTFAPFVAGIGQMSYARFIAYNVVGGLAWVSLCLFGGYFFGNLPFVQKNFSVVIIAIIVISVMPAVIEATREHLRARRAARSSTAA
jgi:membrane-associated protein